MSKPSHHSVVMVINLREFFHDSMQRALSKRGVQVNGQTEQYVVNVLTTFSRADELYEQGATGRTPKPLALMLAEANGAPTAEARDRLLRRLGDVALFTAGFFAGSFARKLVDVDYHIAMGASAYGCLAESSRPATRAALTAVFFELAQKFQRLVDVLNEVAEMSHPPPARDVLRQYEIYLKTGSLRALEVLQRLGVDPIAGVGRLPQ